jgi:hypothetical protein|tara:strand:- start:22382 stop:23236 length:855 start_codon:yes stop_codon:yes gene_type:complete
MAYQDVSASGMNYVPLSQIISDFKITRDVDDFAANASDAALRNFALRGIRELGFDVVSRVKSLKLTCDKTNNTVAIPDDYVDMIKLGVVDSDGILKIFGENKHINYSRKISAGTSTSDSEEGPLPIEGNLVLNREDSKSSTTEDINSSEDYDYYVFENYMYNGTLGRLYGIGGGHKHGQYRINLDQNRIEIDTDGSYSEVVMEYIADEARSTNPVIHVYAEEALRAYIHYKLCERKSTVPANEKARARSEYYNERRKANRRLSNFSKDEAMRITRKNFKLAPKY